MNPQTKIFFDGRLKVYKSTFRKFSTLLLGHEITLMRELKSQQFNFEHETSLESTIKGLCVDFAQKCKLGPLSLKLHIWGILSIRNSVLTMKIRLNPVLRVYKPIIQKVFFIPWPRDCSFGIRNSFMNTEIHQDWSLRTDHQDWIYTLIVKNFNLSPWAWNFIFRFSKYQKLSFDFKNYPRSNTEVLQVNFSKSGNVIHWSCKGIFWYQKLINGYKNTRSDRWGNTHQF